jgi:hypothetical protein
MPFAAFTDYKLYAEECSKLSSNSGTQANDTLSSILREFMVYMFDETYFAAPRLSASV